jgi:glutathionylspermidine synthase
VPNGSDSPPIADSLLIWKSTEQAYVGHIAVITEVSLEDQFIRVAEQNISNDYWPGNYARQLKLETQNGKFFIQDEHEILGWMVINFDVDGQDQDELGLENIVRRLTQPVKVPLGEWLDLSNSSQKFWSDIWGTEPTRKGEDMISFYSFENHFADKINFAAMELNHMCLRATDYVIESDELLRRFGLPEWVWPKIRNCWKGMWVSGWKTFSGRFDLSFNGRTVKMFEYNSDSAGTYLECAVIQVNWANSVGCDVGRSAAQELEENLVTQAKELFSGKFVHLMIDQDDEEIYNAMYIQQVFGKAGVESKLIIGLDVSRNSEGRFLDNEGREIKTVWKMWNWETVITSYSSERVENKLKLSDVLLDDHIDVYEPIWKLVTSNKALLPVLWELFPNHPYLLRTEWNLSEELSKKGYAKKPIVGRCGQNVQIFKSGGEKIEEAEGRYSSRDHIFQEIFEIQEFDGFHPVIGAWIVGRRPAGFGIREDTKLITDHESPYGCCRIIGE